MMNRRNRSRLASRTENTAGKGKESLPRLQRHANLLVVSAGLALGAVAFLLLQVEVAGGSPAGPAEPPIAAPESPPGPSPDPQRDDPFEPQSQVDIFETRIEEARARHILPPPVHHPRPEWEWQGMRVDLSLQAICDGEDTCGLAMSCRDNQCGPCVFDDDCPARESCVLDHCVPTPNVSCSGAFDCASGELCVLSGYSTDPRGNADMHAFCQPLEGGSPPDAEAEAFEIEPGPAVEPRPVSIADLRNILLEDPLEDLAPLPESDREPFDEEREEQRFQENDPIDFIDPPDDSEPIDDSLPR